METKEIYPKIKREITKGLYAYDDQIISIATWIASEFEPKRNKLKKTEIMKPIAQQLNVQDFPFIIKDSKGNEIYYEYVSGFWARREYDSQGNLIYYEDSDGYWMKKEYDSQNNKVYDETSDGYIEDNRNIPEFTMEELIEKIGLFKLKTK